MKVLGENKDNVFIFDCVSINANDGNHLASLSTDSFVFDFVFKIICFNAYCLDNKMKNLRYLLFTIYLYFMKINFHLGWLFGIKEMFNSG
jgi:hypothetical protein